LKKPIPTIDPSGVPPGPGARHAARMDVFTTAGLYLVTSEALSGPGGTRGVVRAALAAGVRLIQLREKDCSVRVFMDLAKDVRDMTREAGALLIINDRLDVALGVDADGVHLGQDDFPVTDARRLAPDLIIGTSTHSVEEAVAAQRDGVSYLNIGPLFPTATKVWNDAFLGVEGLRRIAAHVRIPFTVMGGIKADHIPALLAAGARTLAVVTAVTAAPDPGAAAADLLRRIRQAG